MVEADVEEGLRKKDKVMIMQTNLLMSFILIALRTDKRIFEK